MTKEEIAIGIIIGLLLISLIILFCVVLIKIYINKIKTYTQKLYQKDLDFQKTLNETIVETQEQVLNNISQDLHDDAGQQLTYINFQLENLKLDVPELQTVLEPISQSVGNLSQSIRSISHSLNNQLLLQHDLVKVMTAEVERLQKNPKIAFHFKWNEKQKKVFTSNEKIVIYRIFQELINNTLKHAKATEIKILIVTDPHFSMTVSDNGKGFEVMNRSNSQPSIGLQNMINRATLINYKLEINSKIGSGTSSILTENIH